MPPATQSGGSSGLKVALIALAVILAVGIAGAIAATVIGLRIARQTRIESRGPDATISTPFGEVKATHDPELVARDLGVMVYPGARAVQGGAGVVNLPGLRVGGANFVTDDPLDKVADYYRNQFPKATVDVADHYHQTLVVAANRGMVTIAMQRIGDRTEIHLASVGDKEAARQPQ
jgi:hypothetical protein